MAKKIAEFLKTLINKAGGNADDPKLKSALEKISTELEMDDELSTAIDNGLISIANAKNNHPEIKNHYFATAYNGLDSEIDRIMQDEKFSDEIIAELKNEKSSTKRAILLTNKIKELEREKAGQGKADTKALNDKIAELNGLIRQEKESVNGIKAEYEKKLRDKDKGYAMRNLLGGYKTIHDSMDAETKDIIIEAIINKNLKSKGFKLDVDQNGNLAITTSDGSNAFTDDHRPLTPKIFLDKVMADENLLVVSGSNDNNNQNNNRNNTQNNAGRFNTGNNNNGGNQNRNNNQNGNQNNNGGSNGNSMLKNLVKQAQQDLANSSNNGSIF